MSPKMSTLVEIRPIGAARHIHDLHGLCNFLRQSEPDLTIYRYVSSSPCASVPPFAHLIRASVVSKWTVTILMASIACPKSAGRHVRHNAVNDPIKRARSSANISAMLEPHSLCIETTEDGLKV
jgi:hypothetical protein